jgi:hypothetical protein
MYLTTHHVVSATTQREGFNALLYVHVGQAWEHLSPADVPEQNPGASRRSPSPSLRQGTASGAISISSHRTTFAGEDVHAGLIEFLGRWQSAPLPWAGDSRNAYFRLGMESALTSRWQRSWPSFTAPLRRSGWRMRPDPGTAIVPSRWGSKLTSCSPQRDEPVRRQSGPRLFATASREATPPPTPTRTEQPSRAHFWRWARAARGGPGRAPPAHRSGRPA